MEDRRFIEETFPVKEVGEESAKEKSIRHGHISTLHIWWARRPLASSRATNFAALIPAPKSLEERQRKRDFLLKLSKWDNSLDRTILENARKEVLNANGGKPPRVLDPFAGGGAIPLEALRLGCETYANDYNPVAVIVLKCTLEYPQKYGTSESTAAHGLVSDSGKNRLLDDVNRWGARVLRDVKKEIERFYPEEKDGSIPVGFVWARTVPCQNPSCGAEIPLLRQFWLASNTNRKVALCPDVSGKQVKFKIVGTGYEKIPRGFSPDKGTVSKAIATCIVCGSVVDGETTRSLFTTGSAKQRLLAIVSHKEGTEGKRYRVASEDDMKIFQETDEYLQEKRNRLQGEWGLDPVPDELTPEGKGRGAERAFSVRNYDLNTWGDLFNSRQKLALITFVERIREAHERMLEEGLDADYARVLATYLAIIFDRLADKNSVLVVYNVVGEKIEHVFGRQTLSMVWDYVELNPFSTVGWLHMQEWVEKVIFHCSQSSKSAATVTQVSSTSLSLYPDGFFDAIFTDPPYYDNVPYSYLSDFFYVWLKRMVGYLYPDLFSTPLTPKSEEIVAYSNREGGWDQGTQFFENMLKKSFTEMNRVLKSNGISIIIYAHKSFAGWETLVNSLLDSGLVVTGAWPIHTERKARLRGRESAALASSIYMITRKTGREPVGFYREIRDALKRHLEAKLDLLWNEGISGADFFIAAIGSSIEVFGKFMKVIDDEGNVVRSDKLLEDVRRIVTDYAVKQVLHNGFVAEITPMTRFYVLWRWGYSDAKLDFDDALKLARGVGVDITQEWNRGFIRKDKEFIEVLGPEDRKLTDFEDSTELIDVLHRALLLWKKGNLDEVTKVLRETGYGKSDVFYRVAQAISESLTNGSNEKKLLDGFLSGKERVVKEVKKETGQTRLFQ